jgi:hypothetical protein
VSRSQQAAETAAGRLLKRQQPFCRFSGHRSCTFDKSNQFIWLSYVLVGRMRVAFWHAFCK